MNLSLLTYNCHLFGDSFIFNMLDLHYLDVIRCRKILYNLYISDINIICLQEVWSKNLCDIIIDTMEDKYNFYKPNEYSGLLILSKFKILESNFEPFKNKSFPDSIVTKGFGYITVLYNNELIDIFFSHTQAMYSNEINKIAIQNILQMKKKIDKSSNKKIICGDLNLESDIIKEILSDFSLSKTNNSCSKKNILFNKFQNGNIESNLDYILYDKSFTLDTTICNSELLINNRKYNFKINDIDCSDHYPLYTKFK